MIARNLVKVTKCMKLNLFNGISIIRSPKGKKYYSSYQTKWVGTKEIYKEFIFVLLFLSLTYRVIEIQL